MLRNRLLPPLQHATNCVNQQLHRHPCLRAKSSSGASSSNAARQSKILGKFFGNRVAGSKKRWYPSAQDVSSGYGSGYQPPSVIFQASQFGKSASNSPGSKHNTRRMSVLNKLFMTHITDLLATGEAAESILGRGMQVSRVKISSDFACVNVYWLGSGDVLNDATLEAELQRTSGQLRHELSQLRLMGEVPRIKFVRDKTGSNINNVEGILRTLNLSPPDDEDADEQQQQQKPAAHSSYDVAQTARQEFYGNAAASAVTSSDSSEAFPEMRQDVLGLDHRLIMDKILTKMRKSKQSWEQHQLQQEQLQLQHQQDRPPAPDALEQVQRKLAAAEASIESSNSKFEAFLAKRRERKQTPERKKYRREQDADWALTSNSSDYDELQALTREQRERYTQEDYILEDDKDRRNV